MKKILILLVAIGLLHSSYAQDENNIVTRTDISNYFEENVYPFLQQQQDKYLNAMKPQDRDEVQNLSDKRPFSRSPRGKRNQYNNKTGRNQCLYYDDLEDITEKYPTQNKDYSKAIENKIAIWKNDLTELHNELGINPRMGKDGQLGYVTFFNNISTPEGLLLWKPRSMNYKNKNNRNARINSMNNNTSTELNNEIIEYAQAEVVPVIVSARNNFDSYLSADEKKIISDARAKIEVRKTMFKTWYESEDFVHGQRAKDPDFDGMREDMRSSMQKVRGISLLHNDEMRKTIDNINANDQKWDKDIEKMALSFNDDPAEAIRFFHDNLNKEIMPVTFLLMNTDYPDLFNNDKGMRVFIYPNPFSDKATIAIVGAKDENVTIDLKNDEGKTSKELFSGNVTDYRFEVLVLAEDVKNGAELVTISSGDIVIKRKISLSN